MQRTPMMGDGRLSVLVRRAGPLVIGAVFICAAGAAAQPAGTPAQPAGATPSVAGEAGEAATYRAVLDRYCVACHNRRTLAGNLALDTADPGQVGPHAELWERVLQKLQTRAMPPPGRPRPEPAVYDAFGAWLEGSLDRWAADHPDPGRPAIHRLNRLEYANAVRDLLHLEIDAGALLPADDMAFGFDNNAAILTVAPGLFSRYMSAARTVSRLAVGDPSIEADVARYQVSPLLAQDGRMSEDLPFGSRGGAAVRHHFPRDGDYVLRIELRPNGGRNEPQEIDVRVDGERVALLRAGRWPDDAPAGSPGARAADEGLAVRFPAQAGTRPVSVSFTGRTMTPEGVAPARLPLWTFSTGRGYVEPMALDSFEIEGPYDGETNRAAAADTPSRRRIFVCEPVSPADEEACAARIVGTLARRAFHRPVTDEDVQDLLAFYREGRAAGDFRAGVRRALESILVDPEFSSASSATRRAPPPRRRTA